MKCLVCDREAVDEYCKKFETWKRATGASWKQYLKELVENAYTGYWAKEVAEGLLKNEDG